MGKDIDRELQIERMQSNLGALRKIAGWTTEQLADKLGVTKQTICNLENKENHTQMKLAQYMALETIFNNEIKNNPENELLSKAMDVLINNPDPDEKMYQQKEMYLDTLAAAKYAGKKNDELISFMGMLAGVALVPVAGSLLAGLGAGVLFDKFFEKRGK